MTTPIRIEFSDADVARARVRAIAIGKLKNSERNGEGNIIGCLGEIGLEHFLGVVKNDSVWDPNYDFIYDNKSIEVKSRESGVIYEPKWFWWAGVFDSNDRQQCDAYAWTRVHKSLEYGWLCGWLTKLEFTDLKVGHKKDELDPYSETGWTFPANSHDVLQKQIHDMRLLIPEF